MKYYTYRSILKFNGKNKILLILCVNYIIYSVKNLFNCVIDVKQEVVELDSCCKVLLCVAVCQQSGYQCACSTGIVIK